MLFTLVSLASPLAGCVTAMIPLGFWFISPFAATSATHTVAFTLFVVLLSNDLMMSLMSTRNNPRGDSCSGTLLTI